MGPRHGDELNLIHVGDNYGWPLVSWGNQYSGIDIPDHDTRPEFHTPEVYWMPTIAPSGLIIYNGNRFADQQGNALIGGLKSQSLIRVVIEEDRAKEVERFAMGKRIREVKQGPQGAIWLLEDKKNARLLRYPLSISSHNHSLAFIALRFPIKNFGNDSISAFLVPTVLRGNAFFHPHNSFSSYIDNLLCINLGGKQDTAKLAVRQDC